jgi:ribosomal protein S18 acetylase RimI-like enzyme
MSDPSFSFRRGTEADAASIAVHRRRMFEDMGRGSAAELDAMQAKFLPWIANKIRSGEYLSFLVENDRGQVVGGGGLMLSDQTPSPFDLSDKRGYILNVYVVPECRRRGLARRLMAEMLDYCRAQNIHTVALHASADGRPLYESLGFKPTNEMRLTL